MVSKLSFLTDKDVRMLAGFIEHDLICYRSSHQETQQQQKKLWDQWLAWFAQEYNINLLCGEGIMPIAQQEGVREACHKVIVSLGEEYQVVLFKLSALSGSLVLGLAAVRGLLSWDDFCHAAFIDDICQLEFWGEDDELRTQLNEKKREAKDGFDFLVTLRHDNFSKHE